MRRFISIGVAAALLVVTGTAITLGVTNDRREAAIPQVPADQVASAETYKLRSTQAAETCDVTRGDQLTGGRSRLSVDPSCAALLPGVEKAKYWVDKDDGSVAFTANGVDPIVTFAIADGVAYESLQPAQPVISLDAQNAPAEDDTEQAGE